MGVRLLRCRLVGISGVVTLSSSPCWTMSIVGDGVVAMILVPCDTVVAEPFLTFDSFSVCYRLTGVIFLSRTGTFATVSLPEFWSQGSIVLPSPKFRDVCGHSMRPMSHAECAHHTSLRIERLEFLEPCDAVLLSPKCWLMCVATACDR